MTTYLRAVLVLLLLITFNNSFAQKPHITYDSAPKYFTAKFLNTYEPVNTGGGVGGPGTIVTASGLTNPRGLAMDASGNLFVTEDNQHDIKEIPASRDTVLVVASGLTNPSGVCVDKSHNLYVADYTDKVVKKIPAGGGAAVIIASGFVTPYDVIIDATGNLYVSDEFGNVVKKIPAGGGSVVTIGTGFNRPTGIALDAAGNIFVCDSGNGQIVKIPAGGGAQVTVATGFNAPSGVAVDAAGNLFVASGGGGNVIEVLAGTTSQVVLASGYSAPVGIVADTKGDVYFSDLGSGTIVEIVVGGYSVSPNFPAGINIDKITGVVYVRPQVPLPQTTYKITAANTAGSSTANITFSVLPITAPVISYSSPPVYTVGVKIAPLVPANTGGPFTGYGYPSGFSTYTDAGIRGIAIDGAGNIYWADYDSNQVMMYSRTSDMPTAIPGLSLSHPTGVAVDAAGNIYVADYGNHLVKKAPAGGGSFVTLGSGIQSPYGIALDKAGNVYVDDLSNSAVYEIDGHTGANKSVTNAFNNPGGLAVDAAGNVYVADTNNNQLKKISSTGNVTVIGSFDTPTGVALDAAGNIYVETLYGSAVTEIFANGSGQVTLEGGLSNSVGIAVGTDNYVYVSGHGANALSTVSAGGYYIDKKLPAGLLFSNITGAISGTPMLTSPATNYTIRAINDAGMGAAVVNIGVQPLPLPSVSYPSPVVCNTNSAITLAPSGSLNGPTEIPDVEFLGGIFSLTSVSVDPNQNIYISDYYYKYLKKVPAGTTDTVRVNLGFAPLAAVADAAGNIYAIDLAHNAIKKLPADGRPITTIGSGFNIVTGLAVDAAGNLYIADYGNNAVKKLAVGSNIPVTIGTGFNQPTAVGVDAAGNVYVADKGHNAIKEIVKSSGSTITLATAHGSPNGVAIDAAGNVYYSDANYHYIVKIPVGGQSVTLIGSSYYAQPIAVAVNSLNTVIIADGGQDQYVFEVPQPNTGYSISPALPSPLTFNTGTGLISGTAFNAIPAADYTVKAYNSTGSATAVVNLMTVAKDTGLVNLTVSAGSLSPVFSKATASYTVAEPNTVSAITVTPTTGNAGLVVTVNGTAVASGAASPPIMLAAGHNTINIVVRNQSSAVIGGYTLNVTRTASTNAILTKISTNSGTALTSVSGPGYKNYTTTVPFATNSITVTPVAQDAASSIKVNNAPVASGAPSQLIPLNVGSNIITTIVTAQNGTTTESYIITVTRSGPAAIAALIALAISSGTLSPAFATGTHAYTVTETSSTASIRLTPTVSDATATVTVNGVQVNSGAASQPVPLSVGQNIVQTVVTAQDGATTSIYTTTITRAAAGSSNALLTKLTTNSGVALTAITGPDYKDYAISLPNTLTSITVTPTTQDATATVKVNGVTVASGTASPAIPLATGANVINTVVTAQDGVTIKTYSITVIRISNNAVLTSIKTSPAETLTATTGKGYRNYTATVPNSQSSIQVIATAQDPTATITVNGTATTSGTASAAIPLAVGTNVITTVVTAQDGVTVKSYIITITRISNNALLTKLNTNTGVALATTTGPDYKDYTLNLPNSKASMTVTPITQDATATVKVNGVTVASGTPSAVIPLQVGNTTISTVVTAQDGATINTYKITVTRAAMMALYTPKDSVATDGLTVHPGITPNGDGINDIFTIDGINTYPDNKVTIMSRSGAVVYEAKGYDNQTKFFDGHSNKTGALQLAGTYFYSLEYSSNGKTKVKTGFLVLKY